MPPPPTRTPTKEQACLSEKPQREAKDETDIVELAAVWRSCDKGSNQRCEDGTLNGWYEWAAEHPQRQEPVKICHGRAEWSKETPRTRKPPSTPSATVSVVSWNILSDTWYELEKAVTYTHTEEEDGAWESRSLRIVEWVSQLRPDVLSLQEVDFTKFESDLHPQLTKLGYDGRMQNQKKESATQPCGVATFWRMDTFDKLCDTASFSRAMVVVLRWRGRRNDDAQTETSSCTSDKKLLLCVVNVHLESSQTESGAQKRARQLNSSLRWASCNAPGCPLVVAGDCNTGADAHLFHALRHFTWHGHGLASVYEHPATHHTLPVCRGTFMIPGHHYVIDHMVYSYELLKLQQVLNPLSADEIERDFGCVLGHHAVGNKGFPSALCPSDHLPIGAVFAFCNPPTLKATTTANEMTKERKEELESQWLVIAAEKPPHMDTKGVPTPEQIAERRAFSERAKAWKDGLTTNAEQEFVKALIKQKNVQKKRAHSHR